MRVNRYMNPQKAEYRQTYVSQFVPEPFELMQRKAENEQRKLDSVKDNWRVMSDAMGEQLLTVDMPMEKEAVAELIGRVDDNMEQYQGNHRQLESVIRNVANEWKQYTTTDVGSVGRMSKQAYDEGAKRVAESEIPSGEKELFNRYSIDRYSDKDAALGGEVLTPFEPYTVKDWQDKALKHVTALKDSQISKGFAGFGEDGRLITDGYDDLSEVNAGRVRGALRTAVWGDADFNDMVNKKYEVGQYYGMVDPNLSRGDYKEALFNDMLGDFSEHAYKQHTQRRGAKESSFGRGSAKNILDRGGIVTTNARHYYRKDDFKDVLTKDNDELVKSFHATNDAKMIPFDKAMETQFFQENAGLTKDDFNKALNGVAEENGLDLTVMSDKRKFLRGVADGKIDLSKDKAGGIIATGTAMPKLQQQAKNILMDMRNDSRILDGVAEELASQGKGVLSKEDYNKYNDFIENSLNDRQSLLAVAKSTDSTERERKKAEDELDMLDQSIAYIENAMYGDADRAEVARNKKYLEEGGYGFLNRVHEAIDSEAGQEMLRSRLQNAQENYVNTTFINAVPVRRVDGTIDERKGMQFASEYEKAIENNFSLLLETPVTKQGKDTGVKLKGAITDEVNDDIEREVNTDGTRNPDYGRDFQDVYEERIAAFKNEQLQFGDRFDPSNGSQLVKKGKYEFDLGTAPGQFNFPSLEYKMDPAFTALKRVKTDITKAIKSGRTNTEIEDGVLIHIPQPDQVDKIDNTYEQTFEDGTRYAVRISNSEYGIPSRSDYTMIPQENVIPFMKNLKDVQAKTEENGTWYNAKTNNTLTREELVKQLITRYTGNE